MPTPRMKERMSFWTNSRRPSSGWQQFQLKKPLDGSPLFVEDDILSSSVAHTTHMSFQQACSKLRPHNFLSLRPPLPCWAWLDLAAVVLHFPCRRLLLLLRRSDQLLSRSPLPRPTWKWRSIRASCGRTRRWRGWAACCPTRTTPCSTPCGSGPVGNSCKRKLDILLIDGVYCASYSEWMQSVMTILSLFYASPTK